MPNATPPHSAETVVHVFYASFPEGFQHTPGNHVVDNPFLCTKMLCLYLRDKQGMVVCNLRIVHAPE